MGENQFMKKILFLITGLFVFSTSNALEYREYIDEGIQCEGNLTFYYQNLNATISSSERDNLVNRINDLKSQMQVGRVHVVGYTNNKPIIGRGKLKYPDNYALSKARAQSLASVLEGQLSDLVVSYEGKGPENPIASNNTAEGLARNRRAEVCLARPAQPVVVEAPLPPPMPVAVAPVVPEHIPECVGPSCGGCHTGPDCGGNCCEEEAPGLPSCPLSRHVLEIHYGHCDTIISEIDQPETADGIDNVYSHLTYNLQVMYKHYFIGGRVRRAGDSDFYTHPFKLHHNSLGFMLGFEVQNRELTYQYAAGGQKFLGNSAAIDLIGGLTYQLKLWRMLLNLDLGLYYSMPQTDYNINASTAAGIYTPEHNYGVYAAIPLFFLVTNNFAAGIKASYKYGLSDLISESHEPSKTRDLIFSLTGRWMF